MQLIKWMTTLAVAGAMVSAPLFAQGAAGMQDQNSAMTGNGQASKEVPVASPQASADAIKKLQQALNDKGHSAGTVDGLMGPKTEAALRDFQQAKGLDASGQINAETLTALEIDSSEFAAFGIKEGAVGKESPGAMDQGGSTMKDSGGASSPTDVPDSGRR